METTDEIIIIDLEATCWSRMATISDSIARSLRLVFVKWMPEQAALLRTREY